LLFVGFGTKVEISSVYAIHFPHCNPATFSLYELYNFINCKNARRSLLRRDKFDFKFQVTSFLKF